MLPNSAPETAVHSKIGPAQLPWPPAEWLSHYLPLLALSDFVPIKTVVSLSTLPPELLGQILSHLARPSLGPALPAPSPLLATAVVSRTLRVLSQKLLFHSVTAACEEQGMRWRSTAASAFTRELRVMVEWREDRTEGDAVEWVRTVFEGDSSGKVEVLEMEGVGTDDLGVEEEVGRMEGGSEFVARAKAAGCELTFR